MLERVHDPGFFLDEETDEVGSEIDVPQAIVPFLEAYCLADQGCTGRNGPAVPSDRAIVTDQSLLKVSRIAECRQAVWQVSFRWLIPISGRHLPKRLMGPVLIEVLAVAGKPTLLCSTA